MCLDVYICVLNVYMFYFIYVSIRFYMYICVYMNIMQRGWQQSG